MSRAPRPTSTTSWHSLRDWRETKGSALGFAGTVRPVTTQRLAAWAIGLAADGLVLAPVSALVRAPAAR